LKDRLTSFDVGTEKGEQECVKCENVQRESRMWEREKEGTRAQDLATNPLPASSVSCMIVGEELCKAASNKVGGTGMTLFS
jgi:hypothetical protein